VGPNCLGLYCPEARISTIMTSHTSGRNAKESGPVSLVAQSGWATESMVMEGFERGLRFSKIVSIGNQCDLTAADYIEFLGRDPETGIIAAYLEGVQDGRRLLAAVRNISRKKPVIVWKSGKTAAGARAAASHTGSLAGREAITRAALRQAGVLVADSIFELIDLTVAFTAAQRPRGRRVGVLVEAGGGAVAAADALERHGLLIEPFSPKTQAEITSFLTGLGSPTPSPKNPVDLVWPPADKMVQIITTSVEIMAKECDVVLWVTYCPIGSAELAATLAQVQQAVGKPLVVVPALPSEHRQTMDVFARRGMPTFSRIERAARAIAAMVEFEAGRSG
jgi:acyl-CoA synthetase (NDP forming)